MRHKITSKDFLLAFTAIVIGMSLVFVFMSSSAFSYKLIALIMAFGISLTCLSLWRRSRKHSKPIPSELVVCKETVLVDADGSAEIFFAPTPPVVNPKLFLTAHGRPIQVEDVWHNGISTVSVPRSILYWHRGVDYSGIIDSEHPLKILVRNQGYAPAAVRASITAYKTCDTSKE